MEMSKISQNSNEIMQIISFSIDKEEFGLEILQIQEVIRLPKITKVHNDKKFFKGIIDLRETVIPIIDLREKFGLASKEYDETTRVIVVEVAEKKIGMIVDTVSQVVRVAKDKIAEAPKIGNSVEADYLEGVVRLDDRLIILLKIENLLTSDEVMELNSSNLQDMMVQ